MTFQNSNIGKLLLPALCFMLACDSHHHLSVVDSATAPKAIGPYSQAIQSNKLVFCSGQIGLVPETGLMAGDDILLQTNQALQNLNAVLVAAGSDFSHVVKVTIFLTDLNYYKTVNEIYSKYFSEIKPARSVVQVSKLPKDALIEIECIAIAK